MCTWFELLVIIALDCYSFTRHSKRSITNCINFLLILREHLARAKSEHYLLCCNKKPLAIRLGAFIFKAVIWGLHYWQTTLVVNWVVTLAVGFT